MFGGAFVSMCEGDIVAIAMTVFYGYWTIHLFRDNVTLFSTLLSRNGLLSVSSLSTCLALR